MKSFTFTAAITCLGLGGGLFAHAQEADNATSFDIALRYETTISPEVQAVFEAAKAKWESVIVSDWGSTVAIVQGQEICGQPAPRSEIVDDILIYVYVGAIDGEGNVLARAGPCAQDSEGKIRVGVMQFDLADLQSLTETGRAQATVTHEMGHVLGLGTLWEQKGLIGEPADDTHILNDYALRYLGEQGNIGNEEVGMKYEAVIEDSGGEGTERSHWEEDIYQDELMTGYVPDSGIAPMSALTIRALADLGYTVDASKADSYQVDEGIVDDLDWNDLKASSKARLRGAAKTEKAKKPKRKHNKQAYGADTLRVPILKLESLPRRR